MVLSNREQVIEPSSSTTPSSITHTLLLPSAHQQVPPSVQLLHKTTLPLHHHAPFELTTPLPLPVHLSGSSTARHHATITGDGVELARPALGARGVSLQEQPWGRWWAGKGGGGGLLVDVLQAVILEELWDGGGRRLQVLHGLRGRHLEADVGQVGVSESKLLVAVVVAAAAAGTWSETWWRREGSPRACPCGRRCSWGDVWFWPYSSSGAC